MTMRGGGVMVFWMFGLVFSVLGCTSTPTGRNTGATAGTLATAGTSAGTGVGAAAGMLATAGTGATAGMLGIAGEVGTTAGVGTAGTAAAGTEAAGTGAAGTAAAGIGAAGDGAAGTGAGGANDITGTLGTDPLNPITSAFVAGSAGSELIIYLIAGTVTCAQISSAGWLPSIAAGTQVVEIVVPSTPAVGVISVPSGGEVNYAKGGSLSFSETNVSSGMVNFTMITPMGVIEGDLTATFPSGSITGSFHAEYCAGGQGY